MLRAMLCSAAVLALCVGGAFAQATKDTKDTKNKGKHARATITKVDAKNGTVTVRMKNKEGKEETRTFKLAEDIRYLDSTGRVAAIAVGLLNFFFRMGVSGDRDRDREEEARAYFDRHGRWPEDAG